MTDTQIKDYLKKYRIDSEEQLAKHIEELKRNTIPNNEIIFPLVDLLLNEKSVLLFFFAENKKQELFTRTVTPFFLDEMLEAPLGSFGRRGRVINYSTRHKAREEGIFHKEIVGDLEGVNKPKGVEVSLKELKENTINNVELGLDIVDILGITLCDNRDYIYKLIEKKISAKKDKIKTAKLHTYPLTPEECLKDDVITNSSRGEKETMEYLNEGLKRTEGVKLNKLKPQISLLFKQFPDALEAIAKCSEYGHKKYKETDSDFLNFKRVAEGSKAYADAGLRHRLKKGIDLESMLPHCYHVAWNALAELQLLIEEK